MFAILCKRADISMSLLFEFTGQLSEGRGRLQCPICRRQVIIPDEGFPECFISNYIRDHLNKPGAAGK